ncbi:MAG: maleylpyruvate isomerase family mycothiol-dependent enzyme [Acidimicrobiia bacterium]|nr:MAG: maleylpyruvate isomerase family mycothiol-dependent enzyme [Acidimicrobiia bacterium]
MDRDTYLEHIRSDSALVAQAARRGLEPDVPCCEDWTVRQLVGHLGEVHRHKELIVRERLLEPPEEQIGSPESGLIEWFEEGAAMLIDTLAAADASTPLWTWHDPDQTAGFWYRRMAQETLIHRVDAEQSHGAVSPIDEELAADGVDEIISVFLTAIPRWGSLDGKDNRICLSVPGRSWSLEEARFSGTSPVTGTTYSDLLAFGPTGPSDNDASVSGGAVPMDLWLWGRGPIEDLTVGGDAALVELLRQAAKEETQ